MARTYASGPRHKTWPPDGKPETLVSLKDVRVVDDSETGPSLYAAPDNSILVTRDIGTQEVYAISVKWP